MRENSIIMALHCCYSCRFCNTDTRNEYMKMISKILKLYNYQSFDKVVKFELTNFIQRLRTESGIAHNFALKENVFLMYVCIVNKLPLFLAGNPGCSKTLSINLIIEALRGKDAYDDLLKQEPTVYPLFYQGHL